MPELPEVETIRLGLEERILDLQISQIEILAPKSFIGEPESVIGATITELERYGKLLLIGLSNFKYLAIHLKMTGQLIWRDANSSVMGGHPEASYLTELPGKHTRVIITLSDNSRLYFNDLRRFGYIRVLSQMELAQFPFMNRMGMDALHPDFSAKYLSKMANNRKVSIKAFLLDQTRVAGLGNIYVDESLFRAGILPTRAVNGLSTKEWQSLVDAIAITLNLALEHNGSTEKDYRTAIGEKGTYLFVANVYRRTGQPCNKCQTLIERMKVAGRSSHYCPQCQV